MEEKITGTPSIKDRLGALAELPFTLKRLATALEEQNRELARYRRLSETLADLVEIGQDFNLGFYKVFGGKAKYHPRIPQDDIEKGPGGSDGVVPSKATSLSIPELVKAILRQGRSP